MKPTEEPPARAENTGELQGFAMISLEPELLPRPEHYFGGHRDSLCAIESKGEGSGRQSPGSKIVSHTTQWQYTRHTTTT